MSSKKEFAISVKGLSKTYKIYKKPSDPFKELLTGKARHTEFKALDNISFNVKRGEVVGVIGRNGAGKSTLLKVIAGTLDYSVGEVAIDGKISAILELGTGFNPDYTGRENVYIGSMCLGATRAEVDKKIQSIIDFSELNDVIDQPFKTYSSGMQARLTFSTAISVEPDIFIVDEALAAGDAFFIPKCLRKIKEICASGATVFFVSHSTYLVKQLCSRAIYIDKGKIVEYGDAQSICAIYDTHLMEKSAADNSSLISQSAIRLDGHECKILDVRTTNALGEETKAFFQHDSMKIEVTLDVYSDLKNPAIWTKWTRLDGVLVTSWLSHEISEPINLGTVGVGKRKLVIDIENLLMGDGSFNLTIGIFKAREGLDQISYNDPICLWDNFLNIEIKRKNRPLMTVFDQPMKAYMINSKEVGI